MVHFEPPLQRYGDTQVYIPGNKQWLNITTLGIHSRAIAMLHTPLWSTTFQTMTLLTTVHVHCNCTNSQKERCVYSHANWPSGSPDQCITQKPYRTYILNKSRMFTHQAKSHDQTWTRTPNASANNTTMQEAHRFLWNHITGYSCEMYSIVWSFIPQC